MKFDCNASFQEFAYLLLKEAKKVPMENISKQLICVNECLHKQVKLVSNPRKLYVVKLVIINFFVNWNMKYVLQYFVCRRGLTFFLSFFPFFS